MNFCLDNSSSSFENDNESITVANLGIDLNSYYDYLNVDRLIVIILSLFVSIVGCFLNLLVVFLTTKYDQFHCASMYVRAAYAIIDFSSGIIVILFAISRLFGEFERLWCWFSGIGAGLLYAASNLTALVAVERYFYFCEPMKYARFFTLKSITFATLMICLIAEGYTLSTEIIVGRQRPETTSICRLENQVLHKVLQLVIFFLPAIVCTCFSIYKIGTLINKTRHSIAPSNEEGEMKMKQRVGRKTLR